MPLTRNPEPAVLLSPQGRVGTVFPLPFKGHADEIAVPSRSGRDFNTIAEIVQTYPASPSPQGRVGTGSSSHSLRRFRNRRPLKVGSGLNLLLHAFKATISRRPLKVGSGPAQNSAQKSFVTVAVPSRSGRDQLERQGYFVVRSGRRPLKVGSGLLVVVGTISAVALSRRPLKVGSN